MKTCRLTLLTVALAAEMVSAMMEPGLPEWDEAQRANLEGAGWVAGGILLTDDPVPDELPATEEAEIKVDEPTVEEIADVEGEADEIPEVYWSQYFDRRPATFLVDPQGLLSPVDYRDRLSFLEYHAGDSTIDLFVYVFKGDQDIPGEVREEEMVERFFSEGRPAAVVYYHMGSPQRSVMYLSASLTDVVSAAEQRRALESSVMQAFEKVDPADQIEAFLVQMSIRIYWMERMMGGGLAASDGVSLSGPARAEAELAPTRMEWLTPHLEMAGRYLLPVSLLLGTVIAGVGMSWWMRRRARYLFPEFDVEPRLGGAHAAGVGAVISFASAAVTPASQRDQVPDYLRRM